jgi:dihydrofolate reductase
VRRVQHFVAASLDGFIAGPGGDVSWRFGDEESGGAPVYERADTVLMGRRTYEAALSLRAWPHAGRRSVVFTRHGELAVASPDTVASSRTPAEVVAQLRTREGGMLWLAGGSELVGAFFAAGLVDDLIVALHPVILGGGTPLVAAGTRKDLALFSERRHPSGIVQLTYRVEHAGSHTLIRDSAAPAA